MIECMDKTELAHKVAEVLIHTQFQYWVEPPDKELTAKELADQKGRAKDYYLGKKELLNKFRVLIKLQTALIMELLDD